MAVGVASVEIGNNARLYCDPPPVAFRNLISRTFQFRDSIEAFDFALKLPPDCVKAQIQIVSQLQ